jgi:hypothetical protein
MSARRIKGTWELAKAKLKQKHPELSDTDLACENGQVDEMLKRMERLLGKSPIQMAWLLDEITC